ncbi:MAG: hypothetical protein KDB80_07175 [Planctomycetes bacterium]|nr:hypothetical protein [Planctomycetota bacterium]
MKRQAEYLVRKRDGRCEWLRATKLARSIHAALSAAGHAARDRSLDLATEIVGSLRRERSDEVLCTERLAGQVQRTLIDRGHSLAALMFLEHRSRTVAASALVSERRTKFWSTGDRFGVN